MATEIHVTRNLNGNLVPEEQDRAAAFEMKAGKVYRVEVTLVRNYDRLKWWWKLCEIIRDNSDRWPSKEAASDMLKLKCGRFRTVIVPGKIPGEWSTQYVPDSIAFTGNMEEPEFKALCDDAVRVASEVLSCESEQLHEALDGFFSGKRAA